MRTFEMELHQGLPIIREGKEVILVDTGNPLTLHTEGAFDLLGERHTCATRFLHLDMTGLAQAVGYPITTLLGTDIISMYHVLVDYNQMTMSFGKEAPPFEGHEVAMPLNNGVPSITLEVAGRPVNHFLDTGARLSYLPAKYTSGRESAGNEEDFLPVTGPFNTPTYPMEVSLQGRKLSALYGNLPGMHQMALSFTGVEGIIGYDLFRQFRVLLDAGGGKLRFAPFEDPEDRNP